MVMKIGFVISIILKITDENLFSLKFYNLLVNHKMVILASSDP